MSYTERKTAIAALEQARQSRVLSYVMADRDAHPPLPLGLMTQLGTEPQLLISDTLRAMGRVPRLDLFLYTRGGNTDSVWPLVSLLREYCKHLGVVVPFRAHSAGTLIALGADEVVMTELSELSPVDPTTGNQFNPIDPANPQARLGISVEDVAAYFQLATELADLPSEASRLEVLKELTGGASKVHALALGNVQRVYNQIRKLARNLLRLHLNEAQHSNRMDRIIRGLTEEFYSHLHAINRTEATELLGDWVKAPNEDQGSAIWALLEKYVSAFELRSRFSVADYMHDDPMRDFRAHGALLETTERSYVFVTESRISQRPNIPPNVQIQVPPGTAVPLAGPWAGRVFEVGILSIGWRKNDGDF
jgi:Serine dehydrogenase proteinase